MVGNIGVARGEGGLAPQIISIYSHFALWEGYSKQECYSPKIKHLSLPKTFGLATPLVGRHDARWKLITMPQKNLNWCVRNLQLRLFPCNSSWKHKWMKFNVAKSSRPCFFMIFRQFFFHFTTLEIKGRKRTEGSGQCAKKSLVAATSMF